MLDDSLTSLQWLQNLNIMKSAVSGNSGTSNTQNDAYNQLDDNLNMDKTIEIDSNVSGKPRTDQSAYDSQDANNSIKVESEEFCELDLDSAAIPAATNRHKLSCLTAKTNESAAGQAMMSAASPDQSLVAHHQASYFSNPPLSPIIPLPAKSTNNKRSNSTSKQQKQTISKQISSLAPTKISQLNVDNMNSNECSPKMTISSMSSLAKEREEFRTNATVKPPYSYSQLIILAMKESACSKMTLQMIYDWIIENFSYFKKADSSWQITFKNSIRHNLSLNKCFKKIARQKDEPGKGGFWTLDPEFEKQLNESNKTLTGPGGVQISSPAPPNATAASSSFQYADTTNPTANNTSQKTSFFTFNVTKRRRNANKAANKISLAKENTLEKSTEIKVF